MNKLATDKSHNLVEAARLGDSVALVELLATCRTDVRRYAQRHCHASDVDDAIQESLLVVFRKLGGLRAAAAFGGWLMTVVKHECHQLAKWVMLHQSLDDVAEVYLREHSDTVLRVDLIAEMAQRLSEPVPTIKSRLHRARTLVREYLLGTPAQ